MVIWLTQLLAQSMSSVTIQIPGLVEIEVAEGVAGVDLARCAGGRQVRRRVRAISSSITSDDMTLTPGENQETTRICIGSCFGHYCNLVRTGAVVRLAIDGSLFLASDRHCQG